MLDMVEWCAFMLNYFIAVLLYYFARDLPVKKVSIASLLWVSSSYTGAARVVCGAMELSSIVQVRVCTGASVW